MIKISRILMARVIGGLGLVGLLGCSSGSSTFSILSTGKSFQQNSDSIDVKIDILWVIDTSGSMAEEQQALADNFEHFITNFVSKNYDFRIAVTTTAAWEKLYNPNSKKAEFRHCPPGVTAPHASCTNYPIIDRETPDPVGVFMVNAMQGIAENGDERSFQSMQAALESSLDSNSINYGFHRPDAFLAVILVSDEDDFSHPGTSHIQANYSPNHGRTWNEIWRYGSSSSGSYSPSTSCGGACSPTGSYGIRQYYENLVFPTQTVDPISVYTNYLDQFTGYMNVPGVERRYSVSSFAIRAYDQANSTCGAGFGGMIGIRLEQLALATGGVAADLCGNFADELTLIQDQILNLLVKFYLDRRPQPATIKVYVNGELIPEASANNGEGWTYGEDLENKVYYVTFSTPPPQGAAIKVDYDPVGLDF
jgi:hypothetical protein